MQMRSHLDDTDEENISFQLFLRVICENKINTMLVLLALGLSFGLPFAAVLSGGGAMVLALKTGAYSLFAAGVSLFGMAAIHKCCGDDGLRTANQISDGLNSLSAFNT